MKEWNKEELTAFFAARSSGLIYFYTPLCGTCQLASKMLGVTNEIIDYEIGKMNLNYHSELAANFEIESVPCLLLVKEGVIADKIYAFHSVPFLVDKINMLIQTDA